MITYKRKNIHALMCLLLIVLFCAPSLVLAYKPIGDFSTKDDAIRETQDAGSDGKNAGILASSIVLITVLSYSRNDGVRPCQGANITLKGLLFSYNATTGESGSHLFMVHAPRFREKLYLIRVSYEIEGHQFTRISFIRVRARQAYTRGILFFIPSTL